MHRACTAPLLAHRFASIANQGGPGADLPRKAAAARLTSSCSSADRHVKAQRCSSWRLLPHSRGVMSGIPVPALQATSGQQQQQRTAVSVAAASAAPDRAAPQQDGGGASAEPDVILQYVVLRRDLWTELSWPLGSIVAQACHAATAALWDSRQEPTTGAYCAPDALDHMHKVVLEVKGETQLRNLAAKLSEAGVPHKLWIEQPEDFPTCLATQPAPKSRLAQYFKQLKLCKGI